MKTRLIVTFICFIIVLSNLTLYTGCKDEEPEEEPIDTNLLVDSRDGQKYITTVIGNQKWMAENLNYKADSGSWAYDQDINNTNVYGRLYGWKVATEVCPNGWHLPSDVEWKDLEIELGMDASKVDSSDWRGTNQGTKLKVGGSSGFKALLGGQGWNASFDGVGKTGFFWTSTETDAQKAWRRLVSSDNDGISRLNESKNWAVSVRCIKE